ncbi:MAG: hypothetical protein NC348_08925 [Clostridium sp.]|nr:hypothetical protein [Clostridium sp.]
MSIKMIYEFSTHSINLEKRYEKPTFSMTIGTLELVIDYLTRKILYVQGFFPLVKATNDKIILPNARAGDYYINDIDYSNIEKFDIFSLLDKIPKCKEYFDNNSIVFDKKNGIIQLGFISNRNDNYVKVSDNLIIGYDNEDIIQCIYIIPDKFIY